MKDNTLKTDSELVQALLEVLKPYEFSLINFNIYYNEDHIEYYTMFQRGEYDWCFKYLMDNRSLLKLKHTPKAHKKAAKIILENARAMKL